MRGALGVCEGCSTVLEVGERGVPEETVSALLSVLLCLLSDLLCSTGGD